MNQSVLNVFTAVNVSGFGLKEPFSSKVDTNRKRNALWVQSNAKVSLC